MDAAVEFYVNGLGMKLMFRKTDEEHHEEFAFLELDGGNLELLQLLQFVKPRQTVDERNRSVPYDRVPAAPPYCPHLALKTDDLDGVVRMLGERRIPILNGPLEIPGTVCRGHSLSNGDKLLTNRGVRWLYVADPDNNVLEFVQWL
jgi:catechol 2,3-dioxygenase-like lactoylglutathione lyase family enzyme